MSQEFGTLTNWQQAKQQEKMAKYQASVSDKNRRAALDKGVEDENRRISQAKNIIGEIAGGQAEMGLYGQSASDLLRESMMNLERDRQTLRAGYLQEGQNIAAQADMYRYQAKQYGQQARQVLMAQGINTATDFYSGYTRAKEYALSQQRPLSWEVKPARKWQNPDKQPY